MDITDRNITEPMKNLADILAHIFQRYGSPTTIYLSTLNQLETLPIPSTQTILERNLVQISGAIVMASTKETGILWSCTRIGRVVNRAFDLVTQRKFWDHFQVFKQITLKLHNTGLEIPISMDLWEIEFDRDYFRERLKFLSDLLEAQVAIMRNMKIGGPGPSGPNGPNGPKRQPPGTPQRPNHLLGNEAWTCPLCHLNHGN